MREKTTVVITAADTAAADTTDETTKLPTKLSPLLLLLPPLYVPALLTYNCHRHQRHPDGHIPWLDKIYFVTRPPKTQGTPFLGDLKPEM